jgi:hypothetical protein
VKKNWSGLGDTEEVRDAADRLAGFNCLAVEVIQTGGRPSTQYHINPRVLSGE